MRVDPYAGRDKESNPHSLCEAGQPDPHFTGQVRGEPMQGGLAHFSIPTSTILIHL